MSNHTPGPWYPSEQNTVNTESGDCFDVDTLESTDGAVIAYVINQQDSEFNTRLIAAAPELLEALKGLINVCTHPQSTKADMRRIAREARAAIAKAKGE